METTKAIKSIKNYLYNFFEFLLDNDYKLIGNCVMDILMDKFKENNKYHILINKEKTKIRRLYDNLKLSNKRIYLVFD